VAANEEHSFFLFTIARWACIPFSLLGGYVSCRWARDLYGPQAGLLATTLWCFCPNVIAHGQLITPDVAATSLGMAACYMFWRWLKQPNWHQALVSGAVLGIAELAKTTLLLLFVLWPILWVACRRPRRCAMGGAGWSQELGMLAVSLAVAMYILNLGYGFEGTGARLGDFQFLSATLGARPGEDRPPSSGGNRFAGSWMGALPMPLPKNYVSGVDLQKRDCEGVYQLSYLRGETQRGGWPYYYLYAVAIKTPLGTWLLILMAIGLRWLHGPGGSRCDEIMLLAPAAVIFGFVSSQTGLNQHMRYVLPAVPFVYVWTSRIAQSFSHNRFTTVAAIGALAYSTTSGALVYPHSLSYFNELVGGPLRGPEHLIYSNIDWGQDLLYLKQWLGKHPEARPLKLAYFGRFDPIYAGIEYTAPECIPADANLVIKPIPPGWYAISVNFVRGFPHFTYSGYGTKINGNWLPVSWNSRTLSLVC
jgi:hypothetical protein